MTAPAGHVDDVRARLRIIVGVASHARSDRCNVTAAQSMDQLGTWRGRVSGRRRSDAEITLKAFLGTSNAGEAGAFIGLGADNARYWIKPTNNLQGPMVPVVEQIVGRVGKLIDAPVCEVRTIEIGPAFAGQEFRPGVQLEPGIAHASLGLAPSLETRALGHHADDDNTRRHIAYAALWDWCWGCDEQWLIAVEQKFSYFSHDHGWFLPPTPGAGFTVEDLQRCLETPHEFHNYAGGAVRVPAVVESVASRLDAVSADTIAAHLAEIPDSWPVGDDALEWVGLFLERRASVVAARLRARFIRDSAP